MAAARSRARTLLLHRCRPTNATAHGSKGKDSFPSMAAISRSLSTQSAPDPLDETIVRFQKPQIVEWSHELSNKVSLIGTLVNGVDIQYLDRGKAVARCSIKVKCPPKLGPKEDCCFSVQFWDELAEIAASHLKREDRIFVSGSIWMDSYLGSGNVQKETCKVIARDLKFVGTDYRKEEQADEYKMNFSEQWKDYFDNPHNYWDNRTNKKNPRCPDFKHKVSGTPLWIVSRSTPFWVKEKLEDPDVVVIAKSNSVEGHTSTAAEEAEKLWQAFFANPSDWWDNRTSKKNPRGPDFKHRLSGEALWIDSYTLPKWVHSQLEVLDTKAKAAKESGATGNWPKVSNEKDAKTSFEEADLGIF